MASDQTYFVVASPLYPYQISPYDFFDFALLKKFEVVQGRRRAPPTNLLKYQEMEAFLLSLTNLMYQRPHKCIIVLIFNEFSVEIAKSKCLSPALSLTPLLSL